MSLSVATFGNRFWLRRMRGPFSSSNWSGRVGAMDLSSLGYVVVPEHVHLLVNEPPQGALATAIQVIKQETSKKLKKPRELQFWQRRYYDFNVWTDEKRVEKLRYIHRNPVRRGLVTMASS